jgi:hypothetical protein
MPDACFLYIFFVSIILVGMDEMVGCCYMHALVLYLLFVLDFVFIQLKLLLTNLWMPYFSVVITAV